MSTDFLYVLKEPTSKKVRYVGVTRFPDSILQQHLRRHNKGTPKDLWVADLKSRGLQPVLEIVQAVSGFSYREESELICFFARFLPPGQLLNVSQTHPHDPATASAKARAIVNRKRKRMQAALAIVESIPELAARLDEEVGPELASKRLWPHGATQYVKL